jgi:hypothetical protein
MKSVKTALDKVGLDDLKRSIDMIAESDFLLCRNQPAPHDGRKPWRADFDWFIKLDNVAKILEGKFANKKLEIKKPKSNFISEEDWNAERDLKKHGRVLTPQERIDFKQKEEEEKEKEKLSCQKVREDPNYLPN